MVNEMTAEKDRPNWMDIWQPGTSVRIGGGDSERRDALSAELTSRIHPEIRKMMPIGYSWDNRMANDMAAAHDRIGLPVAAGEGT